MSLGGIKLTRTVNSLRKSFEIETVIDRFISIFIGIFLFREFTLNIFEEGWRVGKP